MKKSEKILLGVLGVVSLYAGYILLTDDAPAKKQAAGPTGRSQYEAEAGQIELDLAGKTLTKTEAYRLDLVIGPEKKPPFYISDGQFYFLAGEGQQEAGGGDVTYNGYLEVGGHTYAIVNGVEYEAGEELAVGGYKLVTVTKNFIIIERHDSGSGKVFKRQVPLMETDLDPISLRTAP